MNLIAALDRLASWWTARRAEDEPETNVEPETLAEVRGDPEGPCPACGTTVSLTELHAHLMNEHSDPEHTSTPILSLVRLPGSGVWTKIRKGD